MDIGAVLDIMNKSIYNLIMIGAPLLLVPLIVGLLISIFQATTQIQEQTLTFVPKILSIFAVLVVLGPWIYSKMANYITNIFNLIPGMVK